MRTIRELLFKRLALQADEADRVGLTKLASDVTSLLDRQSENVRSDQDFYLYDADEFNSDVNGHLWDAVVRVADFYDIKGLDIKTAEKIVSAISKEMKESICIAHFGTDKAVGAFEPTVPGEIKEQESIEISEDE